MYRAYARLADAEQGHGTPAPALRLEAAFSHLSLAHTTSLPGPCQFRRPRKAQSTRPLSETNNSRRLPQADLNSIFSQAFAALRAMPQVKRCGYYPEKSAATAARPAAKPAHPQIPPIRSQ
ncbi:hypothetical protein CGCSCA4_v008720 [Colletotrichum siamense]|nr:hypothetical protein CGCSCA4_v008720 [Colletotrichum siamense]KAF4858343.1 hypothetical protein CGCSCA2_v007301 [Colletotrichum siamense]KAF4872408.1 hypothetical protein CGCSCA1_v008551 [Colletotrichum siamense]